MENGEVCRLDIKESWSRERNTYDRIYLSLDKICKVIFVKQSHQASKKSRKAVVKILERCFTHNSRRLMSGLRVT